MSEKPNWLNVTNILVTLALAINTIVFSEIWSLDSKLFTHLTNGTIHIPRETLVSRNEFLLYQNMRDQQLIDLKEILNDIKCSVKEIKK
jgi:hypothetical protein